MNLSVEEQGAVVIVMVKDGCWFDGTRGNNETLQQIKQCLLKSFEDGKTDIILDLKHLKPASDDWIPILVETYKLILTQHGNLKLANLSSQVEEVMRLTRLNRVFQVYGSIKEAIGEKGIRTHYDNLKILRNASQDEIETAYQALVLKYEPEFTRDNPDAERIRHIIDDAYKVLSDPEKRKEHDKWILKEEIIEPLNLPPEDQQERTDEAASLPPTAGRDPAPKTRLRKHMRSMLLTMGVGAIVLFLAWGARYKPIGSAGGYAYSYDRLTGDILAFYGPVKIHVVEYPQK